jgi:uncharacterized protein YrrD
MLKARTVAGKPILSKAGGEKVASVKDLIVSSDYKKISGVLVDGGGLFGQAKVVPISEVLSFGQDAVIITSKDAVVNADQSPDLKESLDHKDTLIKKKVYSERGDLQAKLNDVVFEESSGEITGFELSGDIFKSTPDGIGYLPADDIVTVGPDAVLIKTDALSRIVANASGVEKEEKEK